MSNKNSSEELQSRREFFKKAAKAALPVVGAVVLSSLPVQNLGATPTSCDYSCSGSCSKGCTGGCEQYCKNDCSTQCQWGCKGTCSTTCYGGPSYQYNGEGSGHSGKPQY